MGIHSGLVTHSDLRDCHRSYRLPVSSEGTQPTAGQHQTFLVSSSFSAVVFNFEEMRSTLSGCESRPGLVLFPRGARVVLKHKYNGNKTLEKVLALACVAQVVGLRPVHRKVADSIPGQSIRPGCGLDP